MRAPNPVVVERVRRALANGPPLQLAVLFGSQARGRTHPESDWDVGILPLDLDLTLHDELELASALSAATGTEVDLVRLDREDPVLGREIARSGVCLLEAVPGTFAAYRANAISRWLDYEEMISPHRARFLLKLAGVRP